MRIRRLDIVGFKSFMDKTVLTFEDGVTGVVGPNGCGKSNVSDAIRWVLGEQSARHLRGRSMEDVIFNGSETKAPLSMAEVMLTFLNDRPSELPAQYQGYSEITVGRRLFRTGESDYLINKTPVRLMDITDLFMGSGVGRNAYSIIEQGRIGQIVSARPEDRRALIEEAAGITKYKKRREAAERKMEATQQNLMRVADIVQELGKQLDSLNRQARRAEKYKTLKAQIRELELHHAAVRFLELTAARRVAEDQRANFKIEEAETTALLAEIEASIEAERTRLADGDAHLQELLAREHEIESTVRVSEVSADAKAHEMEQTGERARAQAAEIEGLKVQADVLAAEQLDLERQREALSSTGGAEEVRLVEAEGLLREIAVQEQSSLAEIESARRDGAAAQSRVATAKSHLAQLERQRIDLKARLAKIGSQIDELATRVTSLDGSRSEFASKLGQTRQLKLRLEEQRGAQEEMIERTRSEFIENEAKLITAREELSDKRARLSSLVEVMRNYEGYGRGVRSLMTRAGQAEQGKDSGVFGLVADVVSAPADYENAVEAVLGERLQYVIVESHSQGVEAIDFLKSAAEGRASLIPLSRLRGAENVGAPSAKPEWPGFVAACLDVVRFDPNYEKVVRFLLGDVIIVKDLQSALSIWQSGAPGCTLVTLDGEVLDAYGVVTGGPLEGEGHGALQRRREMQELEETVHAFEAEFSMAQGRHRTLQARLVQLEAGLKALDRDGRQKELAALDQEKDLVRVGEELQQVSERIGQLELERAELEMALANQAREEEEHRFAAAAAEAEEARAEERAKEGLGRLEGQKRQSEQLGAEVLRLKVKVASEAERREAIGAALRRVEDSKLQVEDRRARLFAAISEANARAAELRALIDGARVETDRAQTELLRVREELAVQRRAHEAAGEVVRRKEIEVRELRKRSETVTQAVSEVVLSAREHALALTHLEEQIRERCQAELKSELSRFHMEPPPDEDSRRRLEELKAQAERMGAINLTAIEEYDELARRHAFLSQQRADLEASIADLKGAIVKINRASKERFSETFDRINEKFQQVFPRLFNGGRAGLTLTQDAEGADGTDGGVEIFSQPPGKKLQSVNLLSGGEKALTAVALVFAIFLIKPTPFCLLDEVDAPLDDANVGRYNDLVREMSKASQFILITHNKRTMEMVDTLYGVTMQEPGISKLVSVKLSQTAPSAAA